MIPGCAVCGGGLPGYVPDEDVCRCGGGVDAWAGVEPVGQFGVHASARAGRAEWSAIEQHLLLRCRGVCECRVPGVCYGGPSGLLLGLPRQRIEIHHRRDRNMGGTRRRDVHTLANLLFCCGACHRWVGAHPAAAEVMGWLVADGTTADCDPAQVPVVLLPSRRRWRLDPVQGSDGYLPAGPEFLEQLPAELAALAA